MFEDYSSKELYQIAKMIAKGEGYHMEADCKEGLIELFDRKQIKGRNDSGNGRLARNIVEGGNHEAVPATFIDGEL